MTIRERILYYLDNKSISKYRFYKETGISNGFLDKEGAIGSDKCVNICTCYPEINPEWLLLGVGSMLKPINTTSIQQSNFVEKTLSVNDLIDKVNKLIAENENLKSEIGILKSYKYDYNPPLDIVAERKESYVTKSKNK